MSDPHFQKPPSTPKSTPGYPKSPPPNADPRGEWYQKPDDGSWVWRVDGLSPKAVPSEAVLVELGAKNRVAMAAEVLPKPSDVEGVEEVEAKLKSGYKWYDAPNGKKVLRKEHAMPDLRPQPTDRELEAMAARGEIKFPSANEVRANVALVESMRRPDDRVRIAPEAAGRLNIPTPQ